MTVSLDEILRRVPEERRQRIEAAHGRTDCRRVEPARTAPAAQTDPGAALEEAQDRPGRRSRIEKRSDLYISTLRSYVEGVGGKLTLVVELPDQPPVILAGLGDEISSKNTKKKAKSATKPSAKSAPLHEPPEALPSSGDKSLKFKQNKDLLSWLSPC